MIGQPLRSIYRFKEYFSDLDDELFVSNDPTNFMVIYEDLQTGFYKPD